LLVDFYGICKDVPLINMYAKYFKRISDFCIALAALIFLLPVYIVFAILIRIKMGSPVIFRQARPGLHEKIFYVMKFRSMTDAVDARGKPLSDAQRITALGRIVRKTSVDEIPQLFNILKGEMSFVGPRPLLPRYLPYYTDEERRRHNVRPGITGLAQVNGRNNLTWPQKLAYDVQYADNVTLVGDLQIMLKTLEKVIKRADIQVVSNEGYFDEYRAEELRKKSVDKQD